MSEPKRYFWLKLHKDFFKRKEIKRLRKIAGGDTYTIIYLEMLLRSIIDDGKLFFDGLEDDFASELALDIDEDEENVKITIQYLLKAGLLEIRSDEEYYLPDSKDSTGSETSTAVRVRRYREKQKALHCNANVTQVKHFVNGEIEIEKEIEIEIEKELEIERDIKTNKSPAKAKRFVKPTLSEVEQYCIERNNNIDAEYFVDFQEARGWVLSNGKKMKDWKATIRTWERNNYNRTHVNKNSKEEAINVVNNLMNKLGDDGNEQSTTDVESTIDITASVHY